MVKPRGSTQPSLPVISLLPPRIPLSFPPSSLYPTPSPLQAPRNLLCLAHVYISSPPAEALEVSGNSQNMGPSPLHPQDIRPLDPLVELGDHHRAAVLGHLGLHTLWKVLLLLGLGKGRAGDPDGLGSANMCPLSWTPAVTDRDLQPPFLGC